MYFGLLKNPKTGDSFRRYEGINYFRPDQKSESAHACGVIPTTHGRPATDLRDVVVH